MKMMCTLQAPVQFSNICKTCMAYRTAVPTQAILHAGVFTATDIQQISILYEDSLLAVEKDGTIQVQPYNKAARCHACPVHWYPVPVAALCGREIITTPIGSVNQCKPAVFRRQKVLVFALLHISFVYCVHHV